MFQTAATVCAPYLTQCFNACIDSSTFPHDLKLADIVPCHKRGSTIDKSNYRTISLLPSISKIFERLLADQMNPFLETVFSKYLCGFRQKHSTHHAILDMLIKWQSCLNNGGKVGAILMDLSKAFDCLSHDLILAKLDAYGFGRKSLKLLFSYFIA